MRQQRARPLHQRIKPLLTRSYLDLQITRTARGLRVRSKKKGALKKAALIPRYRGPFEVRLYTKAMLRDIVTFSFPLTLPAGERTRANTRLDAALTSRVEATTTVRIPFVANLTHLILIDKQRGKTTRHELVDKTALRYVGTLPGPKRTDALGAATLFGRPAIRQAQTREPTRKAQTRKAQTRKAQTRKAQTRKAQTLKMPGRSKGPFKNKSSK